MVGDRDSRQAAGLRRLGDARCKAFAIRVQRVGMKVEPSHDHRLIERLRAQFKNIGGAKINKLWQNLFVVDEMTKKKIESRKEVAESGGLA